MSSVNIKSLSSGNAVLVALRESISSGRWPPGTPLVQSELADEFGVSRIPVREALQTLQSEGLVRIEPNRGTFVSGFTLEQIDEIFDLRVMLEVDALRHAIPRHTLRTTRQLEAIQRELGHAEDKSEWLRLDREFHDALYAPSERERTLSLIATLRTSVERFYGTHFSPQTRRAGWKNEHEQLIAAIHERKSDDACGILAQHIQNTHQVAIESVRNMNSQRSK